MGIFEQHTLNIWVLSDPRSLSGAKAANIPIATIRGLPWGESAGLTRRVVNLHKVCKSAGG